jgi:DNA polymerase-3 subunit delta
MYKKDFDKLRNLPQYCVFYGHNFYLTSYEKKIIKTYSDDNILKMYFDEYDFDKARTHLSESSLFGGTNVLVIKHNKIPQNIEKLIRYTKNSYLFFFYYGNKKPEVFGKNFVRFFEPSIKELFEIIDMYCKEYNVTMSKEAKMHLINSVESSYLEKEIEKLSNYSEEITLSDIEEAVFKYKEESFEELFSLMLNNKNFYTDLNNILEKNDYKRVLRALIRYVRDLYTYNLYIKKTGASSLEGLLGYRLPLHINKQRVDLAIKFKEKDYYNLLKFLLEKELEIRSTEKNKEAIFWEVMTYLKLFNSF